MRNFSQMTKFFKINFEYFKVKYLKLVFFNASEHHIIPIICNIVLAIRFFIIA